MEGGERGGRGFLEKGRGKEGGEGEGEVAGSSVAARTVTE